HLGNGASVAAIKSGVCVDTSMGMTPLEGLVMGTRSGDIDPALPTFLQCALGLDAEAAERLFNKQSGLLGICGSNDMRTIIAQMKKGEKQAQLAFDIFCYRVKKYIGAYLAVLSKVNGVVFTGGIGENAPLVRSQCLKELEAFGIVLDAAANRGVKEGIKRITHPQGKVELLVIPTNEELEIAIQAEKLCLPDNP
ncbi:MAG: acetate kinase, partial [Deltaproteobacteria bacterium]